MDDQEPDFVPGQTLIQKVVVWIRLPGLSLELWKSATIMAVAKEAGRPISVDEFESCLRKSAGGAGCLSAAEAGGPYQREE